MVFAIFKAQGHSMEPVIKEGSFFISSSIPYILSEPKKGENIIFRNKEKIIVKQVIDIIDGRYFIQGINKSDSKSFQPLKRKELLGKVIWIF